MLPVTACARQALAMLLIALLEAARHDIFMMNCRGGPLVSE